MTNILRVDGNIISKPLLCEGSRFTPSSVPTDMFSKNEKRVGHYDYYKYFEKKTDGDKYYSLHSLTRYVTVYLYDYKYYAIVNDYITYYYPDINGYHSRTEKSVFFRQENICLGEEKPEESIFEIEFVIY